MFTFWKLQLISILLYFCLFSSLLLPSSIFAQTVLFSDSFDSGSLLWTPITGSWTIQNIDGSNRYGTTVSTSSTCCSESIAGNVGWSNYIYELDLLGKQGVDKNLIFRYTAPRSKYGIHITNNTISLEKHTPSTDVDLIVVPGSFTNNIVYHAKIVANGNNFKVFVNDSSYIDYTDNNSPMLTGNVGLRVGTGAVAPSQVWFDNVVVTEILPSPSPTTTPTATPTLTPTPTPSPTPSPTPLPTPTLTPSPTATATPLPVSKVVFLPGGGASWNADAILNCKTSGYSGDWTLAPYAEDVYSNILTALSSSNWNTKPFYYDWRTDIRNTSNLLSGFINSNSGSGEKVDLVGHSMGGLISRAYLEANQNQKVDSFISAGSPYEGAAISYPAWSGGEVWDDNFITKIATTIFLKRCGGLSLSDRQVVQGKIPSVKNILPTTNYLRNSRTNQLKNVNTMNAKNNWLPTNFAFGGVRVGTLSGTGFPTLKIIRVDDPSRRDVQLGNWLDGKPSGEEKTNLGDGVVLNTSSQLAGANNQIINQNHTGLMASSQGMSKILSFLGTPPPHAFRFISPAVAANVPNNSVYVEPKSMLVIIGYPGNFWITDKNGNVTHDENGMITFTNPTSDTYQLDLVPQSNDTLFIIAQFLSNGETLYKEYHFSNLQPKAKVIEFDPKKPKEDILKDKMDYHKPHFPKDWWRYFWRYIRH